MPTTTNQAPQFFTTAEVAELWKVSESTVRRMVESKQLDSVKIGRARRIPAAAIAAYLTASKARESHAS